MVKTETASQAADVMWIAVASLKGGTGKTTTTGHLAAAAAAAGERVLLVDADPQGSLVDWVNDSNEEGDPWDITGVTHLATPQLGRALEYEAGEVPTVVLIDCPPTDGADHAIVRAAVEAATLVLVPMAPTPRDVGRLGATLTLTEEADTASAVVINKYRAGTNSAVEIMPALLDLGVDVAETMVPLWERIAAEQGAPDALQPYVELWAEIAEALR